MHLGKITQVTQKMQEGLSWTCPLGQVQECRADTVLQANSREVPENVMSQLSQDKGTQGQGTGEGHSHRTRTREPRLEVRE